MSKEFDQLNKKIIKQFSKDKNMALATSVDNIPSLRIIDAYYFDGSFYIATYETSEKMKEIKKNKYVSLCTAYHEFQGEAVNIGHPLKEENKEIRSLLIEAFASWYFAHNDESDPKMCYLQVKLNTGFTYFGKKGYEVDFRTKEVKSFPFDAKTHKI